MTNAKNERIITQADVDLYKSRIRTKITANTRFAPEVLASLNIDGSWDDIKYDESEASKSIIHVERMFSIAIAVSCSDNAAYEDKDAVAKLEQAIRFWVEKDIVFDNWFYNEISNPHNMGKILITAGYLLSSDVKKKAEEFIFSRIMPFDAVDTRHGSNLVNTQMGRIYYALNINDLARIKSAFDRIAEETYLVTKFDYDSGFWDNSWRNYVNIPDLPDTREGIQGDYSVLFHGPELLSGQYGLVNVALISDILVDTDGTNLFPKDGIDDFINHLLEHIVWIMRGPTVDHNTRGRGVAQNDVGLAYWIYERIEKLAGLSGIARSDEIKAYYESAIKGRLDDFRDVKRYAANAELPSPGVTGNRYYWKGDYTAHQQKNFMLGIRAASKRTIGSEQTNTENTLGNYLGHGATFIYRDGMEYYDIFAAYDWCKIPGTTSQIQEFVPVMIQSNMFPGSTSDCTGGVSDGDFGAMTYQFDLDGLRAKKSWFMFEDEFVALGTDISNLNPTKYVTTVNQNLLRSDVTISVDGEKSKVLSEGADQSYTASWVHQDETGYFFLSPTPVKISVEPNKEGDRTAINYNGAYSRPTTPQLVYRDVFTLWFDHTNNATKNSYEYIVIPQIKAEDMSQRNPGDYILTISNTATLQAVENTKLNVAQAVFWTNGSFETSDGMKVEVNKPALVQVRVKDGKLVVAVASINATEDVVTVRVNKELAGEGVTSENGVSEFAFELPVSEYAGQSVVKTFELK